MYLEQFKIKNFRTIQDLSLTFNKGLNILIGENNSGKTAIVDALRICIGYGNLRRDIYVKESDFHFQRNIIAEAATEIEFHLYFKIENPEEKGWFIDLLNAYEDGGEDSGQRRPRNDAGKAGQEVATKRSRARTFDVFARVRVFS